MTAHPFDFELHLSRHGTALRRLAMELLRDPGAADDAVQETWLRAMQWPPSHEASLGGWMAKVLRTVSGRRRRGERRRTTREAIVAAARGEIVEDHAVVLAREEQAQRLLAAVTALDAPFRDAIWQRYFEGKAPREIAEASREPIATVKSRLQRGLQQLREKLGEEGESDWRSALAVAFACKEQATAVVAGGLLMTVWLKVALAGAVVAAAAILFWSLPSPDRPAPSRSTVAATAASATATDGTTKGVPVAEPAAVVSPVERSAVSPMVPAPANATLRGRCVDAAGAALAGCTVRLTGMSVEGDRMDAWLAEHSAPPDWQEPVAQVTGADGVFALAFAPPPPFRFTLSILSAQCVGMTGGWQRLAAGEVVDVGDVAMRPGITVTGRVTDEQDQPRADARISLQNPFGGSPGAMRADSFVNVTTGADGRFAVDKILLPGFYLLAVDACEIVRPSPLKLAPEPATQDVTIVVKPAAEMVSITGTVVDDADQPIAGAWIAIDDGEAPRTTSGRGGRIELKERRDAARDGVRISVRSFLHEPLRLDQPVAWGTQGVVLRLQRGAPVTVRVTDTGGAPVESFAVRVLPCNAKTGTSGNGRVQVRGPFVDGTATLASLPIGKWIVWIEPPTGSAVAMVTAPIEIVDRSPRRLDLRLVDAGRSVKVVDRAGAAIVGSKVRVADPVEGPIDDGTQIVAAEVFAGMQTRRKALLVSDGVTDAAGAVMLRGPADRAVTLMLDGPGHVPTVRADVLLTAPTELVVTVDKGGSVTGRITPPEALVELRRLTGLPLEGPIPAARAANWAFVSVTSGRDQTPPLAFVLDEQGQFVGHGISQGTWGTGISLGLSWVSGPSVVIREGETSDVVLDMSSLLPGVLQGDVTWNGAPLANDVVHLDWVTPTGREHPDRGQGDVRTDAQGHFVHRGRPGTYTLTLQKPGRTVLWLRAGSAGTVVREQTTHHTFAITSGRIELVLLDREGRPAQVGQLVANAENPARGATLARTDANGPFCAEVEPGEYDLFVLPGGGSIARRLREASPGTPLDMNELMRRLRVKVGHATVVQGQTTTLELRVTAELPK